MKLVKLFCIIFLSYTIIASFLFDVPELAILNETIRVLYFHVPMWFTMIFLLILSAYNAYMFISTGKNNYDVKSYNYAKVAVYFGALGLLTGMIWAKYTWGTYWTFDPKLNGSAISMLIYVCYFVLRHSIDDQSKRRKISSIYNVFAFTILIPLIFILPRMTESLR